MREAACEACGEGRRGGRGFTLLEMLVTLFLFTILMAGTWSAIVSQKRSIVAQDAMMEIQGSIQTGFGELSLDLMHAGYGRAFVNIPAGCGATAGWRAIGFLEAAPFQAVFLYDIDNSIEDDNANIDGPRFTFADDSGGTNPLICDQGPNIGNCSNTPNAGSGGDPNMHAEIVRWTLDNKSQVVPNPVALIRTGSGATTTIVFNATNSQLGSTNVSSADMDTSSQNPNDYILFREVNDRCAAGDTDCTASDAPADGEDIPLAYAVRGPDASANWPQNTNGDWLPMFLYYLDVDGDKNYNCTGGASSDFVWGDADRDCTLTNAEVTTMMTGPASGRVVPQNCLPLVIRTDIQLRGEAKMPDSDYDPNGGYHFRILTGGAKANNLAF